MALVCWLLAGDVALDFDFLHRDLALLVLDRYGASRRLDAKGVLCNTVLNFLVIWNYIIRYGISICCALYKKCNK